MSTEFSEDDDAVVVVGDEFVVVDEDVGDRAGVFAQDSKAANVVQVDYRFRRRLQSDVQIPEDD